MKQQATTTNRYRKVTCYICIVVGILLCLFFQFHDYIVPVTNRHEEAGDLFSVDPYILPNDLNDTRDPFVLSQCRNIANEDLLNFILITSVRHNGLGWMGGTGHLYHFFERIFPVLYDAHRTVWGPDAMVSLSKSKRSNNAIYIVFEEKFPIGTYAI